MTDTPGCLKHQSKLASIIQYPLPSMERERARFVLLVGLARTVNTSLLYLPQCDCDGDPNLSSPPSQTAPPSIETVPTAHICYVTLTLS